MRVNINMHGKHIWDNSDYKVKDYKCKSEVWENCDPVSENRKDLKMIMNGIGSWDERILMKMYEAWKWNVKLLQARRLFWCWWFQERAVDSADFIGVNWSLYRVLSGGGVGLSPTAQGAGSASGSSNQKQWGRKYKYRCYSWYNAQSPITSGLTCLYKQIISLKQTNKQTFTKVKGENHIGAPGIVVEQQK